MRSVHRAPGPTEDRDGYHAVQLGFHDKKRKNATQAERGHARKVNAEPKRYVREVRQSEPTDVTEGQTLTVELFKEIKHVDVTGTSKGVPAAAECASRRHGTGAGTATSRHEPEYGEQQAILGSSLCRSR